MVKRGQTLKVNGAVEAGLYQIFAGSGHVIFGSGSVRDIYPQWWGAKGDGIADDTHAIKMANEAASLSGKTLYVPSGVYLIGQVNFNSRVSLLGEGIDIVVFKARPGASGPLLNFNMSSKAQFCEIGNFTVDMTDARTITAIYLFNLVYHNFHDIRIIKGNIGLYADGPGDSRFYRIYCFNQTLAGIKFRGDPGSEGTFEDCLIRVDDNGTTLESGFDYARTTSNDSGGMYLRNVRITRGAGTINNGFRFHSALPATYGYIHMTGCVADNINGSGACVVLENMVNFFSSDHHFAGANPTKGAVKISGGQDISFVNGWLDGGESKYCYYFENSPTRVSSKGNILNQGIGYNFEAPVNSLFFDDILSSTVAVSNNPTYMINSVREHKYATPNDVYTHPTGGALQTFALHDPITNKKKYLRVNNGQLEILNDSFTSVLYSLGDDGVLELKGGWNSGHIAMSGYHIWVDKLGRLRIKSGAPKNDTDGTIVGQQR